MNSPISKREQEVLQLIAYENSTKMIANELFISEHTVISHRKNLMSKLKVSNTAGLMRRAYENGLLRLSKQVAVVLFMLLGLSMQAQVETEIDPDRWTIGNTITIDGDAIGNGGQVSVKSVDGSDRIVLQSQLNTTNNTGGVIGLYNQNDIRTLFVNSNDGAKAARIQLTDSLGSIFTNIDHDFFSLASTIEMDGRAVNDGGEILIKSNNGDERIGLFSQSNTTNNTGGLIRLFNENNNRTLLLNSNDQQKGARIILTDSLGVVKMTMDSDHNGTGDSRIITDELEIEGGSDLAELFDITDHRDLIQPGYVVSLDPDEPGKLMLSNKAYDKRVAGVLSGANGVKPGILMGQDNMIATGDDLVTLSGRTYVVVNDEGGKIQVGDLITTSSVSGEAMRAKKNKKAQGAVIGKAMTPMTGDKGYVLVLVNLQ